MSEMQKIMEEHVAEGFRRMLGLSSSDAVPKELEDAYFEYRYMNDILTAGKITPKEMLLLAMMTKCKKPIDTLKKGDKVLTMYGGAEVEGVFIQDCGDGTAHVKVDKVAKFRSVLMSETRRM